MKVKIKYMYEGGIHTAQCKRHGIIVSGASIDIVFRELSRELEKIQDSEKELNA